MSHCFKNLGTSPEEEGLLSRQIGENQSREIQSETESEHDGKDVEIADVDDIEELECEMIEEYSDRQPDSPGEEDTEFSDDVVPIASPDTSMVDENSDQTDNLNFGVNSTAVTSSPIREDSLPLVCVLGLTDDRVDKSSDDDTMDLVDVTADDAPVKFDDVIHITVDSTNAGDHDIPCVGDNDLRGRKDILCYQPDILLEYESAADTTEANVANINAKEKMSVKDTVLGNNPQVIQGCGLKETDDRDISDDFVDDGETGSDEGNEDDDDDDVVNFDILYGDSGGSNDTQEVISLDVLPEEGENLHKTRDVAVDTLDLFSSWPIGGCDNETKDGQTLATRDGKHDSAQRADNFSKMGYLTEAETIMDSKDRNQDCSRGAQALYEEGKEIFITDSLAESLETKAEKSSRATGDTPLLRPLLSSIKHRKVAPKSKDHKVELEKGSRKFMCDVVEYI